MHCLYPPHVTEYVFLCYFFVLSSALARQSKSYGFVRLLHRAPLDVVRPCRYNSFGLLNCIVLGSLRDSNQCYLKWQVDMYPEFYMLCASHQHGACATAVSRAFIFLWYEIGFAWQIYDKRKYLLYLQVRTWRRTKGKKSNNFSSTLDSDQIDCYLKRRIAEQRMEYRKDVVV